MTKDRLKEYRALCAERKEIARRIREVRATMESPAIQKIKADVVAGGTASRSFEKAVFALDRLYQLYLQKEREIAEELILIEGAIAKLPSLEREILRARYIDGKLWEVICAEKHYSWQQIHRIHAEALRMLFDDGIE